ncbi:hypothetical protein HaLaN_27266, partial [Haematococcus lacustris]
MAHQPAAMPSVLEVVRRAVASALALAIVCLARVDAAQAVTTEQLLFLE